MKNETENKWPSFEIKSWKSIPVITRKVASQTDAENSLAVFCLKNAGAAHKAFEIELPKLAYLTNEDNDLKELIVIIQAECTENGLVIGYRNPNGGNGACLLYEFELLTNEKIEQLSL